MWNADFTCNVQLFIFYLLFQSSRLGRVRFTNDINFKVNSRWLQGRLSLSSFRGRSNEYQEFRGTLWLKVNCLLLVAQQPWGSWTSSIKRGYKIFKSNSYWNKVWNMFKVNNKETPDWRQWCRSDVSIVNVACSSVSIVNFEWVNAGWETYLGPRQASMIMLLCEKS